VLISDPATDTKYAELEAGLGKIKVKGNIIP
jgi:hypothetical protein